VFQGLSEKVIILNVIEKDLFEKVGFFVIREGN
jgi:hypothetical protein